LPYRDELVQRFIEQKIDVFIGIDAPDFNLVLRHNLNKQALKPYIMSVPRCGHGDKDGFITLKRR
jgi:lipid A disaccharide synthetase